MLVWCVGCWLAVAVASGMLVAPAGAVRHIGHASGRIAFYGDVGNPINSPYRNNPLVVRPAKIVLFEDGSWVLEDLRWRGWGNRIARANGVSSSSTCKPDCASAPRVKSPAKVTLSHPRRFLGHKVYSCFQLTIPSHPQSNEHECLQRTGKLIAYSTASKPSLPTTTAPTLATAGFYSVPGWYCSMAPQGVSCENDARGYTASLSPSGEVSLCNAGPAACKVGNPGLGVPSIGYGQHVTVQPFRCTYASNGLTCVVVTTGRGFRIGASGSVTRIGP